MKHNHTPLPGTIIKIHNTEHHSSQSLKRTVSSLSYEAISRIRSGQSCLRRGAGVGASTAVGDVVCALGRLVLLDQVRHHLPTLINKQKIVINN